MAWLERNVKDAQMGAWPSSWRSRSRIPTRAVACLRLVMTGWRTSWWTAACSSTWRSKRGGPAGRRRLPQAGSGGLGAGKTLAAGEVWPGAARDTTTWRMPLSGERTMFSVFFSLMVY